MFLVVLIVVMPVRAALDRTTLGGHDTDRTDVDLGLVAGRTDPDRAESSERRNRMACRLAPWRFRRLTLPGSAYDDRGVPPTVGSGSRSGMDAVPDRTAAVHERAFDAIGGAPTRHIKYDNLSVTGAAVIHGPGRARNVNERWVLIRSQYEFDAFYCQPGIEGAQENGGVEGAVGWFRRNHLAPTPHVDSLGMN